MVPTVLSLGCCPSGPFNAASECFIPHGSHSPITSGVPTVWPFPPWKATQAMLGLEISKTLSSSEARMNLSAQLTFPSLYPASEANKKGLRVVSPQMLL